MSYAFSRVLRRHKWSSEIVRRSDVVVSQYYSAYNKRSGRCLPASDYISTAHCRNGIKDSWGHWCKTTTPIHLSETNLNLVSPIKKERWGEIPWKRFKDVYRFDCDAYKQNPRKYREIGIEEIRVLKLKKPYNWEQKCRELEEKFLECIKAENKTNKEKEEWVEKNNTRQKLRFEGYDKFSGRFPKNRNRRRFHYELTITMENFRKCQRSNKLILNIAKRWVNNKTTYVN